VTWLHSEVVSFFCGNRRLICENQRETFVGIFL